MGGRGGQMEAGRNSYVTRRGFVTVHGDRDARRRPRRFRHRHHSCCHRPSPPHPSPADSVAADAARRLRYAWLAFRVCRTAAAV